MSDLMAGNRMKVLELFAGTRSIGKAFERRGHDVLSVDWSDQFQGIGICDDVMNVSYQDILYMLGKPDVIWASPDCTTYSIAGIGHHRRKDEGVDNLRAISEYAETCDRVNLHVHNLIMMLTPPYGS